MSDERDRNDATSATDESELTSVLDGHDETSGDGDGKDPKDGKRRIGKVGTFVIGLVAGAAVMGLAASFMFTAPETATDGTAQTEVISTDTGEAEDDADATAAETEETGDDDEAAVEADDEDAHEHEWQVVYETVHHDAVTHTETVEPVYEEQTTYHTVCNECREIIDGEAAQHIRETGHSGYSTSVPITDTVLVSDGYTEEVVDTPAYDEQVATELVCPVCGETYELEGDAS